MYYKRKASPREFKRKTCQWDAQHCHTLNFLWGWLEHTLVTPESKTALDLASKCLAFKKDSKCWSLYKVSAGSCWHANVRLGLPAQLDRLCISNCINLQTLSSLVSLEDWGCPNLQVWLSDLEGLTNLCRFEHHCNEVMIGAKEGRYTHETKCQLQCVRKGMSIPHKRKLHLEMIVWHILAVLQVW